MKPLHFDAINPFTGKLFTFDDSNLKFVNGIGVYLEPGDEGFTPYPGMILPPSNKKRNKTNKHMKRNSFYPSPVGEQILWLTNFHTKLVLYAAVLGITNAQRDGAVADARWLIYVLGSFIPALRPYSKACTEFARAAQTGDDNGVPMVVPVFEPPPLPAADPAPGGLPAVVPRPPGALRRIFSLIQVMQELPTMTDAIETDLQIVGTAETPPDLATVQPVIKVMREGQFIFVDWGWGGLSEHLDLCQIQVDRGDGKGWVDLSFDPNPGYLDQTPHPAALTQWKYRAIYRVGTAQVGLWSAEASIVVGGGN